MIHIGDTRTPLADLLAPLAPGDVEDGDFVFTDAMQARRTRNRRLRAGGGVQERGELPDGVTAGDAPRRSMRRC